MNIEVMNVPMMQTKKMISLPRWVEGYPSPYPTVVIVTRVSQKLFSLLLLSHVDVKSATKDFSK